MISLTNLGSVLMVVDGIREMGLLVADTVFILNWFNSRLSYFGFQLGFQSFSHKGDARLRSISVVLFPLKGDPQG